MQSVNINNRRERIYRLFSDFIDNIGIVISKEAKSKAIDVASDNLISILSDELVSKDFVEAKVIKETSGLATNENLAKLEDKLDNRMDKLDNRMDKLDNKIGKIEDKIDRLLMWFIATMIAMLAVLVPLILTTK